MPTQGEAKIYNAVQNPTPEAIVVYCGDPRFQEAFEGFIANELKLAKGQYIPMIVAAAPKCWRTRSSCPRNSSS